jgi:hypothetical protein
MSVATASAVIGMDLMSLIVEIPGAGAVFASSAAARGHVSGPRLLYECAAARDQGQSPPVTGQIPGS